MNLRRRQILRAAIGAAALPVLPRLASAQASAWPNHPVRFIVPFPPGSAPDIVARLIGQWLNDLLAQPFVVDNRPGAGSNIGTEAAVRSAPDGYNVLMTVLTNVFNTTLYRNLSFNFINDIIQVGGVANAPYVMIVPPSFPAKTVPEFIAYAKANPGKINFASGGKGSSSHIFGELFKSMAGVDMVHVPYRTNYMSDLMSNVVQVVINPIPQALELVRSGKLRALAVTTLKRLKSLPDVPTVNEFVPGYEALGWYALGLPKGTPKEIVDKLNATNNKALADPKLVARLGDLGVEPMPMSTQEFTAFVHRESDKWGKVIRDAGVVLE
jgi:tripartite-type tricarboxylate transporter receptor subunit TctC